MLQLVCGVCEAPVSHEQFKGGVNVCDNCMAVKSEDEIRVEIGSRIGVQSEFSGTLREFLDDLCGGSYYITNSRIEKWLDKAFMEGDVFGEEYHIWVDCISTYVRVIPVSGGTARRRGGNFKVCLP